MHDQAEHGVAAHWAYAQAKSAGATDESLEKGKVQVSRKLDWVKQLVKWHEEMSDSKEFLEAVKFDALQDRIYVFTPKGDVYDLPEGATPVDFAYALHTGMGNYIRGATVNGAIVPLSKKLKKRRCC
jgi:GTP pyrophosphokinase